MPRSPSPARRDPTLDPAPPHPLAVIGVLALALIHSSSAQSPEPIPPANPAPTTIPAPPLPSGIPATPVGQSPGTAPSPASEELPLDELLRRAWTHQNRGLLKNALETADLAVQRAPEDPRPYHLRSRILERLRRLEDADVDLSRAIALRPSDAALHFERGMLRLRLARFAGSVADLDTVARLQPARAAELWQRGIALFYAGRYADGRRQFELHRTANPHDVENSAWHYACIAQLEGPVAARAAWIPVDGDARVPMAQIQDLMSGKGDADAVLRAAEQVTSEPRRAEARFYAQLYLALHFGAQGQSDREAAAAAEAARAAENFGIMGDIARLHADWVAERLSRSRSR